jgi:hypothetical protein
MNELTELDAPAWMMRIETLLLKGEYQEALVRLDQVQPESLVEKRIMFHLRAQISVYQGDLEAAKTALLTAERHCGENIAILRDLACVYYQTGEMHQWRNTLLELSERLENTGARLKASTWIKTTVTLAKFKEEDGAIAEAAQSYVAALNRARTEKLFRLEHLALIQLLRIESLYARGAQLGQWYRDLMVLSTSRMTFDLLVEREHTLMLAEIGLVGAQHAWTRVERMLADPRTSLPDRRLLLSDYLAETLTRGFEPRADILEMARTVLLDGDSFEREIGLIAFGEASSPKALERLQVAAAEMSWACYLRLITIHHQLSKSPERRQELANKLSILLSTLTPTSRFYWMKRVQERVFSDQLSLEFHPGQRWVKFQGKTLDLSKKRTLCAVLQLVANHKRLDVDVLIRQLWQADFSPEHLHRLRMAVHRLNQLLFELSAVPRVLEMSAEQVAIKATIAIEAVG